MAWFTYPNNACSYDVEELNDLLGITSSLYLSGIKLPVTIPQAYSDYLESHKSQSGIKSDERWGEMALRFLQSLLKEKELLPCLIGIHPKLDSIMEDILKNNVDSDIILIDLDKAKLRHMTMLFHNNLFKTRDYTNKKSILKLKKIVNEFNDILNEYCKLI